MKGKIRHSATGKRNSGFTLIEMMIVVAIMAILFAIAIPFWTAYRQNAELKSAAGNIVADIADLKARASTERLTYTMTFTNATGSPTTDGYRITRQVGGATENVSSKSVKPIEMTGADEIRFDARGTTSEGEIKLKNSNGRTATINVNITGRTNVQYSNS